MLSYAACLSALGEQMPRRGLFAVLTGTLAILAVGAAGMSLEASLDLYFHDVYVAVNPRSLLIFGLVAAAVYFALSRLAINHFNQALGLAGFTLIALGCFVAVLVSITYRQNSSPHHWQFYSLFVAAFCFLLGLALFLMSVVWALAWTSYRSVRKRFP